MSSIYLATGFKIGMYLLNREKRLNAFPRSTDIIQVLNELPIDKKIHVLRYHEIEWYALHTSIRRKKVFEAFLFKCFSYKTDKNNLKRLKKALLDLQLKLLFCCL